MANPEEDIFAQLESAIENQVQPSAAPQPQGPASSKSIVTEGEGSVTLEEDIEGYLSFEGKIDFKSLTITRAKDERQDIIETVSSTTQPITLDLYKLMLTNLNAIPSYDELKQNALKSVTMQWLPKANQQGETKRFYSRAIAKSNRFNFHVDYQRGEGGQSTLVETIRTEFKEWITNAVEKYNLAEFKDPSKSKISWLPITMNPLKNAASKTSVKYTIKPSLILKKDYIVTNEIFEKMFGPGSTKQWTIYSMNRTFTVTRNDAKPQKARKDLNRVRQWEYTVNEVGQDYASNYGILIQMVFPIDNKFAAANPGMRKISGFYQYTHQTEAPTDIGFGDTLDQVLSFIMKRLQILDEDFRIKFDLLISSEIAPLETLPSSPPLV